jgi:hypothetical protein
MLRRDCAAWQHRSTRQATKQSFKRNGGLLGNENHTVVALVDDGCPRKSDAPWQQ